MQIYTAFAVCAAPRSFFNHIIHIKHQVNIFFFEKRLVLRVAMSFIGSVAED